MLFKIPLIQFYFLYNFFLIFIRKKKIDVIFHPINIKANIQNDEPEHEVKFLYQIYVTNKKNVIRFDKHIRILIYVSCVVYRV